MKNWHSFCKITKQLIMTNHKMKMNKIIIIFFISINIFSQEKSFNNLKEECKQLVTGTVYKKGTTNVISGAVVIVKDVKGKIVFEKTLRSNAKYRFYLPCNAKFTISANRDDYQLGSILIQTKDESEKLEKDIELSPINTIIEYETISGKLDFTLGGNKLSQDSKYKLTKAVLLLKHNSKAKIYIESHTDSRGNDDFNMELTKARIQKIKDFLKIKGIKDNRIIAKAYGETKPLNKCTNKVKCTNKEYLKNRRTTFQVK